MARNEVTKPSPSGRSLIQMFLNYILTGLCLFLFAGEASAWRWETGYLQALQRPDVGAAGDPDARYIDYQQGDDGNDGTRRAPWKHHPWDEKATGRSRRSKGVHTYVFKRGVTYRGLLRARESGTADNPIRLTSDPAWGEGRAIISGAEVVNGGWGRCEDGILRRIPPASRPLVWCHAIDRRAEPRLVWETSGDRVARVPIARTPNWHVIDPDDPRSAWHELGDVVIELTIKVDDARGFAAGDELAVNRRQRPPGWQKTGNPPRIRALRVEGGELKVEVYNWYRGLLKRGDRLVGPRASAAIKSIAGTHSIIRRLVDRNNLSGHGKGSFTGAVVWAERQGMPKPDAAVVDGYDPDEASLSVNFHRTLGAGPMPFDRYYLEGLPEFLDEAGEYVFVPTGDREGVLVLRLEDDRDPNTVSVELAARTAIVAIHDRSFIEVSGLGFRFSNQLAPGAAEARHAAIYASAIQINGNAANITIRNADFEYLPAGIVAFPGDAESAIALDNIVIDNNRFRDIDGSAIALGNGRSDYRLKDRGCRLIHASVRDNRLENTGQRVLGHFGIGSQGHAIQIDGGEIVEVAGNDVHRSYGSGISVYLGSDHEHGHLERPFLRSLIHHNRVVDSLLALQDAGGIESWLGGPSYLFDNESGNPLGCIYSRYKVAARRNWYRKGCFGAGYYLDGQYKGYVFNNIAWGKNNDVNDRIYNSVAFNEAMGFMNTVFHNTFYRFGVGLHKGMIQHNRNYYLANIFADTGTQQILQESDNDTIEFGTLGYARNLFLGETPVFGSLGRRGHENYRKISQWRDFLKNKRAMAYETGTVESFSPGARPLDKDFRLTDSRQAVDNGVKVFVPWALSAVAGEWHFRKRRDAPQTVTDESFQMTSEWKRREMFHRIPRNDLACPAATSSDYRPGILEDWVEGALDFDSGRIVCEASRSGLLDMTGGRFLVEAVIKAGNGGAVILSKRGARGYELMVEPDGRLAFLLDYGPRMSQRDSSVSIVDGKWHHVLVDIDRSNERGIDIYIDGRPANGQWSGVAMGNDTLETTADFLVGGSDGRNFRGQLDFLRIAQGNLADAETGIDELYAWEFNGPFLRDRNGILTGKRRDTGAIEYGIR